MIPVDERILLAIAVVAFFGLLLCVAFAFKDWRD